jgi:hypothetical protein
VGGGAARDNDRYAGRILNVGKMLAQPDEPIPWRCENLVADGYLTVLAGRGGEGKSWLALTLACGVGRGEAAAGIRCTRGRALIFDAENGPKLKQLARETGAAVLLIHHRGKNEASDYRGSSVILDQTDLLFTLGRVSGDPEGRRRRKITTIKCRIEEEPEPRWVRIEVDREHGRVYVNECDAYEEAARPRDEWRDKVLGQLTGVPQSRSRIATALGRGKSDGTIRRALEDLERDGLAVNGPKGWGVASAFPLGVGHPGHSPENRSTEPNSGWPPTDAVGHPSDAVGHPSDGRIADCLRTLKAGGDPSGLYSAEEVRLARRCLNGDKDDLP